MTEEEVFNLKLGDSYDAGDGVRRTIIRGPSFHGRDWRFRYKQINFLVSFDNGWGDLVTGYERGNPEVIKNWKKL